MRIVIVGAGIAGLTLALRLGGRGHQIVLLEKAPHLRDEGYMLDFFGSGFDAAAKMGILPQLERIHYPIARLAFLTAEGREQISLPYASLRRRLFSDRHFNFMRGDLERVLYAHVVGAADVRFGTTVEVFERNDENPRLRLSDGSVLESDLVVGADGVHSRVRDLVWGAEDQFSRYLGYHTAAFIIEDGVLRRRIGDAFYTMTLPGRMAGIYPLRGDRIATFFVHEAAAPAVAHGEALFELLAAYHGMRWMVPELLERARAAKGVYFDTVTQIVVPTWSKGRIVLLGDACQCVSLLAGQGASMAMAGAFVLAEELDGSENVSWAFEQYERRMRPAVEEKQRAGRSIARWFVPHDHLHLHVRNLAMRMSTWPLASTIVRKQLAGRSIFESPRA